MTIPEVFSTFKRVMSKVPDTVVFLLILTLVGSAAFGLGRLSALESSREGVQVYSSDGVPIRGLDTVSVLKKNGTNSVSTQAAAARTAAGEGEVVGSKNSNKYHLPWCSGAQRISEANKIFFKSIADAESAGYIPASNCPGL